MITIDRIDVGPSGLLALIVLAAWLLGPVGPLLADDVVVYRTGRDGRSRARLFGEVLDYTGQELRIRQASGRQTVISASRVVEVQSQWTPEQKAGDRLLAAGKFAEALAQYRAAAAVEHRPWVGRRLLAQQVWCQRAKGDLAEACTTFLSLYRQDPTTQYFDAIPLAWSVRQLPAGLERLARSWLEDERRAAARLIAVSWLLPFGSRSRAMAALRQLANDPDARISHLAGAQLWRTQIVTATRDDVARWQRQIERMPKALRAGPYFVLGQAMARGQRHEEAALMLLRVPILYPRHRHLAAEALDAAGRQLERLGRLAEAAGLYREIVSDYAEVPVAAEATVRLKRLDQSAGGP